MNPYDYHDRILLLRTQAATIFEHYGIPTFTSTLKIDRARMWDKTLEALAIGEVAFRDWGRPDTRERILGCLDEVIHTCNVLAIPFPAVFLLRRKQLNDGDFVPERRSAPLFEVVRRTDGR